jgi:hypothetical protein
MIINCNRLPGAIVPIALTAHISVIKDGELMNQFTAALRDYVDKNPRIWESFFFARTENINADMEQCSLKLVFKHQNTWQEAGTILLNRSDLMQFVYKTMLELNIQDFTGPQKRVLFQAGAVQSMNVPFKRDLLDKNNVLWDG